jgi:isoleucyl-tRNA synthetase
MSPIAPFFGDWLYLNMTQAIRETAIEKETPLRFESVHLTEFVKPEFKLIDNALLERMDLAQQICSMVLAIRKKEKIKVRQPLQSILIPVLSSQFEEQVRLVQELIISEVNVKEIKFLRDGEQSIIVKSAKPDFKKLGPRAGASMKEISSAVSSFKDAEIKQLESDGSITIKLSAGDFVLERDEIEIVTKDVEGWQVAVNGKITVALDLHITPELRLEGIAREIVNKIQNMRKDNGYEVNDRINVKITPHVEIDNTLLIFKNYICNEILANEIITDLSVESEPTDLNGIETRITINKVN